MSEVRTVVVGQEITFDVTFFTDDDDPVDFDAAPTYVVRTHDKEFILDGTGSQDVGAPERWTATFTMPDGVPATEDPSEFYYIRWAGTDANGVKHRTSEKFRVSAGFDEEEGPIQPLFVLQKDDEASDIFKTDRVVENATISIVNPLTSDDETVVHDDTVDVVRNVGGYRYYGYDIDLSTKISNPGLVVRQVHWEVEFDDGDKEREIHDLIIVTSLMLRLITEVRNKIDKGQIFEANPSLRIYDWQIACFIITALERINSLPATITGWGLQDCVTNGSKPYLIDLACIELLRAQYLAEGLSAFNFSGQSTQLDSDRTQYLQTMIDMTNTDLEEKIRKLKKSLIRRGGGVLMINVGASTNYPALLDSGMYLRARLFAATRMI